MERIIPQGKIPGKGDLMAEDEGETKTIREGQGLTLAHIHEATKIPIRILQAIEEGHYDELPEPVYARRFISIYAKYLGIEPEEVLRPYEEYLAARCPPPPLPPSPAITVSSHRKRQLTLIAGSLILITFGIVALSLLVGERVPPSPSMVTNPPATPATAPAPAPVVTPPPRQQEKELRIAITARELTWLRITADDETPTEILLRPGERIARTASSSLALDIGNAGGVEVTFQGKSLGVLGQSGEVVHLQFP